MTFKVNCSFCKRNIRTVYMCRNCEGWEEPLCRECYKHHLEEECWEINTTEETPQCHVCGEAEVIIFSCLSCSKTGFCSKCVTEHFIKQHDKPKKQTPEEYITEKAVDKL